MSAPYLTDGQEAAVIDVGSNSVRLVVYRVDGRALTPTYNEKVTAGLGRDLQKTRRLSREGVEIALKSLQRFRTLCDNWNLKQVYAVGTAAVREAADGQAFAKRMEEETGFPLRILDGADEARFSALGVLAGAPDADGIVGDLGGASLELIEISPKGPGRGETFALGPLALKTDDGFDYGRVSEIVAQTLATARTLPRRGGDFHAVGGAWRALGRIDLTLRHHPIGVLHHHEMSRSEVLKLCDLVRKQSKRSLEKLEEAAARRADSLPYAAAVLEGVVQTGGFSRVYLSAFGLREGVLLERMDPAALKTHPLIAAAEALAGRWTRSPEFGPALERWIAPMLSREPFVFDPERERVLRGAAARLADVGAALHPDQRIEIIFDLILRAPLAAISHAERAFVAAAIHHRYAKAPPKHIEAYQRLLTDEQQAAAAALGAALRLGADFSGRNEKLLEQCSVTAEGGKLVLRIKKNLQHMLTEQPEKRLESAADALKLTAEVRVT